MTPNDRPDGLDRRGLFHLAVVYVVWGSTYLAIRVAVRDGAGFPPFTLALLRVSVAGAILLGWGALRGARLRLTRPEAMVLAGSGVLMWLGGNGLVTWAEKHADSGLAALLVAVMPIWGAMLEALLDRKRPSFKLAGSLALGFLGVGVLTWPILRHGVAADVVSVAALLLAPFWWAMGSLWFSRRRPDLDIRVMSGWQHLAGAVAFLIVSRLLNEPLPTPTPQAWGALVYLTLFGSVFAFTSYITVLRLLPMQVAMTYAYANPVIAVILGRLILGEPFTVWTAAGSGLVLAGIAGVFRNK